MMHDDDFDDDSYQPLGSGVKKDEGPSGESYSELDAIRNEPSQWRKRAMIELYESRWGIVSGGTKRRLGIHGY